MKQGLCQRRGRRLGCSRRLEAVASHVFRGLGAIAAEFHAAPAAGGGFFWGREMEGASFCPGGGARGGRGGKDRGGGAKRRAKKTAGDPAAKSFSNSTGWPRSRGRVLTKSSAGLPETNRKSGVMGTLSCLPSAIWLSAFVTLHRLCIF